MEEKEVVKHRGRNKSQISQPLDNGVMDAPEEGDKREYPLSREEELQIEQPQMQNEIQTLIEKMDWLITLMERLLKSKEIEETKENRRLCGFNAKTLTTLVNTVNTYNIQREDIITVLKHDGVDTYYTLLYYV